ncbi:MAG: histidyl-tRNA synthetase, partial [candidate division Zixibacteria bacterium DG_27]
MKKYQALHGTKDILPPESSLWQYIEDEVREVMRIYNYREIRFPIFEHTELFQRGIGESTDIVTKEMYTFKDMGGRSLTLRPEGTASVVRAYIQHSLAKKSLVNKLYYLGPMFRQERPQKGRMREFHQFAAELLGTLDPAADAEMIDLNLEIYRKLGLKNLKLYLNSVGCPKCRPVHRQKLLDFAKEKLPELCPDCNLRYIRNPLRMFDCKVESCQIILKDAPVMLQCLCDECRQHFEKVKHNLQLLSMEFEIDDQMVRGIDYYTKTAFEIKTEELGAQDSLSGGGRYDLLTSDLGGEDTPAIGFAAGTDRLIVAIESQKISYPFDEKIDIFVAPVGEEAKETAMRLLFSLRREGHSCEMDYLDRSLKAQMREANRLGAKK